MAGRLKGKVAVVTAAGQGIGRGIAEAFIAEGATVIATDLDVSKLKGLKKAKKVAALDVRSNRAVEEFAKATIKQFGAPDILMNCAGFVHQGTVLECSDSDWDFSFDLNVKSIHRMLRAFVPAMLKNGGGSIINIASVASSVRGLPSRYVYGATKAAVIGLTKAMAADYVRKGIRVNAICPGTIQSPSLNDRIATNAKKSGKSSKAVRQDFIDRQPIGRLGTAEEIAAGAVWLASDESSYYTGQTMQIDGGMTT
jgi:2-keto-3-deoxy-L-fuconate dehydrogenase